MAVRSRTGDVKTPKSKRSLDHAGGRMYTSDANNWRFSKMTKRAGIGLWHAHEGRHTAISIMSSNGVPFQEITGTVGHKSTHVTETVYGQVVGPTIRGDATVMDDVLGGTHEPGIRSLVGAIWPQNRPPRRFDEFELFL
jgi:integrase